MEMGLLDRLRAILKPGSENFLDFTDMLAKKYGVEKFLLATTEGLPITGNFESIEELSAELPELKKQLSHLEPCDDYLLATPNYVYIITRLSSDVIMLARGSRFIDWEEIEELKRATREELKL